MAWVLGSIAAAGLYAAWPNAPQQFREYEPQGPEWASQYPKGKKMWTTEPNDTIEFELSETGPASKEYPTLVAAFKQSVDLFGDKVALRVEKPGYPAAKIGEWDEITWKQYYQNSELFARALLGLGFKSFAGVTICGFNAPGWFYAHMGCMMAQGLSAGCYTTNSAELCFYVADHSESEVVVVDSVANLQKFLDHSNDLKRVKQYVVYLEDVPAAIIQKHSNVCTMTEFLKKGEETEVAKVEERIAALNPRNACTLIYTSGTTGNPKACMISHDTMLFTATSGIETTEVHTSDKDHHMVSYLPMSHIAAQIADLGFPIVLTSQVHRNCTINFCRPDALKGSLPITLKAVQPTIFFGVPRVWEKFVEGIKAKAKAAPATGAKLHLVNFAKRVGKESSENRQVGGTGYIPRGTSVANKLVHTKVREALGLNRCDWCLSAAAPIQRETLDFLASLGIDIQELFGMSETCGPATISAPFRFKFGTVGFCMKSCELKIDHQEGRDKPNEGEICFRGRHLMMGYLRNPDKTRETIDEEGWLHSGDVGSIDEHGMLRITGRIKELIIGAGGENIAPVPIEDEIKRLLPAISNCVMIGDKRKYNVCLVSVKCKQDMETGYFTEELVNEAADVSGATTVSEAIKDPKWQAYVEAGIKKYNSSDACPSNAQKIQKFAFLPTDLSIPGGELTGTMKVKRGFVCEKYSDIIEGLYA